MSDPTVSTYWNQTTPAVPSGDQPCVIQSDNATPQDSRTVYPQRMVGDSGSGGKAGTVPPPAAGDAAAGKFLKADGSWQPAATQAGVQQESYTYAADTGSANAYAVTLSPVPTLVAGSEVVFKAANANTGASTLAVNGGSAIAIKKNSNTTALGAGDISAGQIVTVKYDGTVWQMIAAPTIAGGTGVNVSTSGGTTTVSVSNLVAPTIRAHGIYATIAPASSTTATVTIPPGAQSGDLAIMTLSNWLSGTAPTTPSGWTYQSTGSAFETTDGWSEWCYTKVLASGDISTGSVTITQNGNAGWVGEMIVMVGSPTVRELKAGMLNGSGAGTDVTLTTAASANVNDMALYFQSQKDGLGNPGTLSLLGRSGASVLDAKYPSGNNWVGKTYSETIASAGAITATFHGDGGGSASVSGVIVLLAGAAPSGSVTNVSATTPSWLTASVDNSTTTPTINISAATGLAANLILATPNGSTGALSPRAMVANDMPVMVGDSGSGGTKGAVPAPASGDAAAGKFLKSDGSWAVPPAASGMANPMTAVGDLIIGGTVTGGVATPTALAKDSDGKVLTLVSGSPAWAAAGASSYAPSLLPTPPTVASLTWVNQGGATADNNNNMLYMNAPASAAFSLRMLAKALTSTTFTFSVTFKPAIVIANSFAAGIGLRNSSSGKAILMYFASFGSAGALRIGASTYNSPTAFGSNLVDKPAPLFTGNVCFQIKQDGTNRTYSWGVDDGGHFPIQIYTEAQTTFITPDQVVFAADSESSSSNAAVTFTGVNLTYP